VIPAVLPTYARADLSFERGAGAYLFASDGRKFLDFSSGVAVTALGHTHPHLVAALTEQAQKLWHCSNLYNIPGQQRLAERLTETCFADTAFFCNSGAEAMECAIKVARKYHAATGHPERYRLVCCTGSFHGRTLATLAAAGNEKYLAGFGPAAPGFDHVAFGNLNEMRAAIGPETAAIIVEPVQGEGGLATASADYLEGLRDVADEFGILLVLDEVQSGMGRTGRLFAHQWTRAAPDVMALAKGLGGGFPVGACLATARAANGMTPGSHGSTYGGNPLATTVGLAAFDEIANPEMLDHVRQLSGYFGQQLQGLKDRYPDVIAEIRGKGLLIGLKLIPNNREFMQLARDQRLLIAGGGENCVRLLPALIMTVDEAREVIERLEAACQEAQQKAADA
jgi:acetylornithine/N-succinyldiaminopimelate aminotransferase